MTSDPRARHLLRALLRECTYLPDEEARSRLHHHVVNRFRKYAPRQSLIVGRKPQQIHTPERLRSVLHNAQKNLNLLRRANQGEDKALLNVLLWTYGRVGRRRRDLLDDLVIPDSGNDSQIYEASIARLKTAADPTAINDIPRPVQAPTRMPDVPQKYTLARQYSRLIAMARSQKTSHNEYAQKTKLRHLDIEIPLRNIWERPFPRKREKNLVHKWYAKFLDRIVPPLPEEDWMRLRDLATGARKWEGVKPRRARATSAPGFTDKYAFNKLANVSGPEGERFLALECRKAGLAEDGTKEEKLARLVAARNTRFEKQDLWLQSEEAALDVLLEDGLDLKRTHKGLQRVRSHHITERLMRRMWGKVFERCPVLLLDEKGKWIVEWGAWETVHPPSTAPRQALPLFEGVNEDGRVVDVQNDA